MENSKINKIEELYLKIFKIVILAVLSLTLFVSVVMILKSASEYFATPVVPEPAKVAPQPSVGIDQFLKELDKKEVPVPNEPKAEPTETVKPEVKKDTSLDDMVEKYVGNIWLYTDSYQKACQSPIQSTKDEFMKGFPKRIIREWFNVYGKTFAESQDNFEKMLLSNQRVIQICKEKQGKAGILFRSLDWHRDQWVKQLNEGEAFEKKEAIRVAAFERAEERRVALKKEDAYVSLVTAAIAFGIFMSLALLLIFSKIESNLRNIKVIERDVEVVD
jgi:hypothetical protein